MHEAAYGANAIDRQRGVQGRVDMDYTVGAMGAEISLGAGDAAFVRR